jgi:DNA polymerase I - 3''-5'' exonuclease and polymerase domains
MKVRIFIQKRQLKYKGCTPEEVDEHKRRIAKTVDFGIVYGRTELG